MNEELKTKIRSALTSPDLESKWESLAGNKDKYADDLNWIKAVRDECSAAVRRASNEVPLFSRLQEYKLRQAVFNVIFERDGQRAIRSEVRAKLMGALYDVIYENLPEEIRKESDSKLLAGVGFNGPPAATVTSSAPADDQWDDVILVEGQTVTILGQRKMIIKKDKK